MVTSISMIRVQVRLLDNKASFGGSRMSGTNDKAGSAALISRFVTTRSIKENFGEITTYLNPSNF